MNDKVTYVVRFKYRDFDGVIRSCRLDCEMTFKILTNSTKNKHISITIGSESTPLCKFRIPIANDNEIWYTIMH